MKRIYKCLRVQEFNIDDFNLVPIRDEDRYKIMQWRNEQIFHLRQKKELTIEDQDAYFENIISKIFDEEQPDQILFSILQDKVCIGYGGLVHIDWQEKRAEISLLINTKLEKSHFEKIWNLFLSLIERIAFYHINLDEIFTFSYEVRPKLYPILHQAGFIKKDRISNHITIKNKSIDALIHVKRKKKLSYRPVQKSDAILLFKWTNNSSTRENSISSNKINWEEHIKWFDLKIKDPQTKMFLFQLQNHLPVGILRLEQDNNNLQISFSVDVKHRGKGIGNEIIRFAVKEFNDKNLLAQVIDSNEKSHNIFLKNNFSINYISNKGNRKVTHYIKKSLHETN